MAAHHTSTAMHGLLSVSLLVFSHFAKLGRGLTKLARLVGSLVPNAVVLGCHAWTSYRLRRRLHLIGLVEHVGDIVACEPVIRALRRTESMNLLWIVRTDYVDLVRFHPDLHAWLGVTCLTEWALLRRLFWFLTRTDLHIDRRRCHWFGISIRNYNSSSVTLDNYYRHGNLLTVLARSAGLEMSDESPVMHFGDTNTVDRELAALGRPFAVFHCRSNEQSRDWSSSGFQRIAGYLVDETPLIVVEIGLAPVLQPGHSRIHDFCGRFRLDQYGYLISRSRLFVGVDSGFAHMANAVNTFGVILIGQYRGFRDYMPYSGRYGSGEGCLILRQAGPLLDLDAGKVITALRGVLPAILAGDSAQEH